MHQILSGQHSGCYQTINSDVSFLIFLGYLKHKSGDTKEGQFFWLSVYFIRAEPQRTKAAIICNELNFSPMLLEWY